MESKFITDTNGFCDFVSRPFRSSPVESLPSVDEVVKSPAGFLNRGFEVRSMTEYHINIVKLKSFKGIVSSLNNMFTRKAFIIRALTSPKDFGGNNKLLSGEFQLFEGVTHSNFGLTTTVNFSSI